MDQPAEGSQTFQENQTPQDQSQPQPKIPTTYVKLVSWPKIIITLVVVVIITAVIVWAYWSFILSKSEPTSSGPIKVVTPSKQATPSAQKDETKDWKLHTNEDGKFSFKYPPSFKLSENEESITVKPSLYSETSIESCGPQILTKGWRLSVTYDDSFVGEKITLKQLTNYEFAYTARDFEKVDKYETTLGGQEAMRFTYQGPSKISDCYLSPTEAMERIITVNKSGLLYTLESRYLNKDKESVTNIFNQILSTFKFLD